MQSERENAFLLAQYTSLREEVLKRIELQHQIVLGALVAVGTILTVGATESSILLVYPFLALFLALAWSQNDHRNRQITQYLAACEERFLSDASIGWEHRRSSSRLWIFGSRKVFAARGIFIGSQVLTLLLYWIKTSTISSDETFLLAAGVLVTLVTVLIIGFPSRKSA
jgi:hypothetical protein